MRPSCPLVTRSEFTYGYDPETKQQSSQWKMKSKVKSMLIIFFDIKGSLHKELILAGQTASSSYYCAALRRLRENVRRLRPELWLQKNLLLHHDNTPPHTSIFTKEFQNHSWPPATSLFLRLKIKAKSRHFDTTEAIEAEQPHRTRLQGCI
jgi:hypothetical protein